MLFGAGSLTKLFWYKVLHELQKCWGKSGNKTLERLKNSKPRQLHKPPLRYKNLTPIWVLSWNTSGRTEAMRNAAEQYCASLCRKVSNLLVMISVYHWDAALAGWDTAHGTTAVPRARADTGKLREAQTSKQHHQNANTWLRNIKGWRNRLSSWSETTNTDCKYPESVS